MIKAGVFEEFEQTRATLLASFEQITESIQNNKKKGLDGQVSMFDIGNLDEKEQGKKYSFEVLEEMSDKELLSMEKEMLGIYISGHPLEKYREQTQTTISTIDLREINEANSNLENDSIEKPKFIDGQKIKYAGIITSIKKKYTKNNKIMAFVTIEDLYGVAEILVFESTYLNSKEALVEENIVLVDGRLSIREDDTTIIASTIQTFGEKKRNVLIFNITDLDEEGKVKLRGGIKYFAGDRNNICVFVQVNDEQKPCGAIFANGEIIEIFKKLIGEERVILKTVND